MAPEEASLVDRGAMFLGSTVGGGLGGLATGSVRKIPGLGKMPGVDQVDMLGSMVDMIGHQGAMAVSALVGGGKNVYELWMRRHVQRTKKRLLVKH